MFSASQQQAGGQDAAEGLGSRCELRSACCPTAVPASSQATLSACALCPRRGLHSAHVTCQAAQASIAQPSIFFDFFQLLQVQTQLLGKAEHVTARRPCPGAALRGEQTQKAEQPTPQDMKPTGSGPWAAQVTGELLSLSANISCLGTSERFP